MKKKELENYVPLSKYWTTRMGVLDILNGKKDIIDLLEREDDLGEDLQALLRSAKNWDKKEIDIGESGTLFRYLQFVSWKLNLDKKFIKRGTLKTREVCNNPEIINWPLKELLKLDNNCSQWASAAVLAGNTEKLIDPPYFLKLTYEALKHWEERRAKGLVYELRRDPILLRQAETFLKLMQGVKIDFKPDNPDDYCFARAFKLATKEEGLKNWPELVGHESNRIDEMEKELGAYSTGEMISSKDHRVVQAIAMMAKVDRKDAKFQYPGVVNKSWPKFWDFLNEYSKTPLD